MDQDSTKGSDKRNWRERLGIGGATGASPSKDLPRISDDYQTREAKPAIPQGRPTVARSAAVKPAPMAPRAAKPGAPVAPEKLAERLRSQREAQAKLAEQRVQIARQRGEQPSSNGMERSASAIPPNAGIAVTPSGKPKFTFAEEEQNAAPMQARVPGQLQPPRQPLGATPTSPVFQPRPGAQAPPGGSAGQGTMRPGLPPAGYSPPPFPGYRPFEQSSGYVPPTRGMNANPGTASPSNGYAGQPRLNVPGRPSYPPGQDYAGYSPPPGLSTDSRFNPPRSGRIPPPQRTPAPQYDDALPEDGFYPEQMPPPRAGRRSAADYQQAYRDMEQGYDEEPPRSRGPWILLGLLLLALAVAMAGVWYYQTTIKPQINTTNTNATNSGAQVPVVEAPAGQTTAPPEQPDASASGTEAGGKKQIYDRIVGDQENVNGQLAPTEEVPIAPPVQGSQTPDPTVNPAAAPAGSDDAAPLPIPPPPDEYGSQGSPVESPNNAAELTNPAAGDSQAAAVSEVAPAATPPAPGETAEAKAIIGEAESETIEPSIAPAPKPVVPLKKKVAAKKDDAEGLGGEPVVLVPPAGGTDAALAQSAGTTASTETGGAPADDLYGTEETVASTAPVTTPPVVKKKKKTLADLFNGTSTEDTSAQFTSNTQAPQPVKQAPAPAAPKPVAPAPAEVQVASAAGYVAQLASFRTRQEASTEFGRLKSKHGGILQGTTPIISEATVAGSTRYRLAVGSFASKDGASSICSRLIAAGERDCLVKRQ